MENRQPTYPGRVKLTPVAGQENVYDMVRQDQPTQEGTPLNKATFLQDATAALFQLGVDAVPDEVFQILSRAALVMDDGSLTPQQGGDVITLKSYGANLIMPTSAGQTIQIPFSFNPYAFIGYCRDGRSDVWYFILKGFPLTRCFSVRGSGDAIYYNTNNSSDVAVVMGSISGKVVTLTPKQSEPNTILHYGAFGD